MELLQLKYFLAVAESEHMTNTAKQLHIAQPALTQSIHRLEQELGVSLFERAGRGIRLSPAGAYVRDRVKPAMETLENVARDVQLFQQGEQGVVRVGVHAASGVAIDGIAAYSELNPHVSFEITQDERERHRFRHEIHRRRTREDDAAARDEQHHIEHHEHPDRRAREPTTAHRREQVHKPRRIDAVADGDAEPRRKTRVSFLG